MKNWRALNDQALAEYRQLVLERTDYHLADLEHYRLQGPMSEEGHHRQAAKNALELLQAIDREIHRRKRLELDAAGGGAMIEIRRHQTEGGFHVVLLVKEGTKWTQAIAIRATGLVMIKIPNSEREQLGELTYKGQPYPVKRALRHFRRMARQYGATKAVKQSLKSAQA